MPGFKVTNCLSSYLLLAFLLLSSSVLFAQKLVVSSERFAGFRFATDKAVAQPIVHYQQNIHMLSKIDDRPSLKVFGDGRVLVHYPVYMKKAGDYEMQLDEVELVSFIKSLSANGIMDFDEKNVREKKRVFEKTFKAKGQFYEVSDAVETVVNIKLDEYQRNKASKKIKNFRKQFKWKNIEHDASRYKNDSDITKASHSIGQLKGFMKDGRLRKRDLH